MDATTADIRTPRLVLRGMSPAFLDASLRGSPRPDLESLIGLRVPEEWSRDADLIRLRLGGLLADPGYVDWSLRAIGLPATGEMVGHAGFHTRPGAPYLAGFAPAGVELGYTVYPPFRRRGYAREAALGLIRWAKDFHGVGQFVASVGPSNVASRSLLAALGFVRVGGQEDEVDGYEDVLLLAGDPLSELLSGADSEGTA